MLDTLNVLNTLKANPLFRRLDDPKLACLVPLAQEIKFEKGEYIINEGDAPDMFYILQSGTVDVTKKFPEEKTGFIIRSLTNGDCIGEVGLLDRSRRLASVQATTPVVAIGFSIDAFYAKVDLDLRLIIHQNISFILIDRLNYAYDVTIALKHKEQAEHNKGVRYKVILLLGFLSVACIGIAWFFRS